MGNLELDNDFSEKIMIHVGSPTRPHNWPHPIPQPHLSLNMDATQFRVGGTTADKVEVVVVKGANETNLKCKSQKKSSGITADFIKYNLILSAPFQKISS
jgi:hypothetical protein